ncbi:MAG: hypothetical protein QNJ31_09200 [Candidatus Caenarcaniphilales bacterium]|nr:hypothetical protein [Candidatus Caenarcaniphilales bacterium]
MKKLILSILITTTLAPSFSSLADYDNEIIISFDRYQSSADGKHSSGSSGRGRTKVKMRRRK